MFNNSTPLVMPVTPSGYGYGGGGGMFGGDFAWIIVLALLFNWGDFGGGREDVRAAVDQQTLISKLDNQTYGLADSTYALNNTIVNGFHGVDSAICNLGYNMQSGFNTISHQLSDCLKKFFKANKNFNALYAVGSCAE